SSNFVISNCSTSGRAPASICRRTAAPRRRLRTSSSIALSRSSTSSSSISMSLSRVTRKAAACSSFIPGNKVGGWVRMTVSRAVKTWRGPPGSAGRGTKRASTAGTCTTANSLSASPGRSSSTARLSDLLSRCGNGWPGSMASGVSTGKISRRNNSPRWPRSASVRSLVPRTTIPSFSRAGRTSALKHLYCRATSSRTTWLMRSICSAGAMRSAPEPRAMPDCTFCCRPPTRTMKNSSRLELTMARNLSRSSSGTSGSWASSRTRRLNSSQLNSRLMYSDGSSRETAVGAITACMRGPPFACTRYCNTNPGRASSSHPGGTDLQLAPAPSLMKPGRTFPEERMGNPTPRRAHGLRPVGPATVLLVALLAPLPSHPAAPSPPSTPLPGGTPAVSLPDLFEDRTAESGIDFTYHNGEEADHGSMLESLGGGVALLDYDGDGLLDVFLTGGGYFDGPDKQQIKGL